MTMTEPSEDKILVDLSVEDPGWGASDALQALAEACAEAVLAEMRDLEPDFALGPDTEVSLLFCDDARIKILNRDFRGKDKPTNVLSFPGPEPLDDSVEEACALGDIALARETIFREADEQKKTPDDHLRHMIVHGLLHLLGFDHEDDEEAEEMEATEIAILARLGVENPYLTMEDSESLDHERP